MTTFAKPEVGQGATQILYSDRNPYTVVRVSKGGKRCWVRADNYRRTDNNGMSDSGQCYEYTPNPDAPEVEVRWTGKRWMAEGIKFVIGRREKYHDYCF